MVDPSTGLAGPERRSRDPRSMLALLVLVTELVVWNLTRDPLVPGSYHLSVNVMLTVWALVIGWAGELGADDMGLSLANVGKGVAYGGAVVGVVLAVLVVAVLVAPKAFQDDRVEVGVGKMLFEVLVEIPLATVMFEEVAFRGVLLGLLRTRLPTWPAVAVSAVLFGLWHVDGVVHRHDGPGLAAAVAGTLVATTLAGLGFAWLRVRSGSLVAPMLAHWATNSLAFVVAWVRWH